MRLSRAALAVSMIVLASMAGPRTSSSGALRRVWTLATVAILAMSSAGCIENMGDLKEALGVVPPPPPPEVFDAPAAKAQAALTTPVVGVPVTFLSTGSADPGNLALSYAWDFGDGASGTGPAVSHAYGEPGEFLARLVVTNSAGLSDSDSVALRVLPADRAPTVALRIADARGIATDRGMMDAPLAFTAMASDPEGRPLDIEWAFGDGGSAQGASASHAYAAPGVYDVRVKATDPAGQVATAAARVAVDASWSEEGSFAPAAGDAMDIPFLAAEGARIEIALTFPAGFGLHDLDVLVLDAEGEEVARSEGAAQPGGSGETTRELTVERAGSSGEWTARVVREAGLDVAWTLDIVVRV